MSSLMSIEDALILTEWRDDLKAMAALLGEMTERLERSKHPAFPVARCVFCDREPMVGQEHDRDCPITKAITLTAKYPEDWTGRKVA